MLVIVVSVVGLMFCEVGSKMVVIGIESIDIIGGGYLEFDVIKCVREMFVN